MKSKGLGKGLGALIAPDLPTGVLELKGDTDNFDGEKIYEIPLDKIDRYESQPRESFDDDALGELADSIKEHGLLQPIIVSAHGDRYRIVAGERRFRAAMLNKMPTIRAIVRSYDEKKTFEVALIENLQRENLNSIEEAKALNELKEKYGLTLDQISTGHARALLGLSDTEKMKELANDIIELNLSVREVEAKVSEIVNADNNENKVQKRARGKRNNAFPEAESDLSDKLEMKVVITGTREKGKIIINYNSEEEVEALIAKIKSISEK